MADQICRPQHDLEVRVVNLSDSGLQGAIYVQSSGRATTKVD